MENLTLVYNGIFKNMLTKYADLISFCSNIYYNLDTGHNQEHMKEVVVATDELCRRMKKDGYDVNTELAICIAYLHDIGRIIRNKDHEIMSRVLFDSVRNLHKYFTNEEKYIIKNAITFHRTANCRVMLDKLSREEILSNDDYKYIAIIYDADKSNMFSVDRCKERIIGYNTYYYDYHRNKLELSHEEICENLCRRFWTGLVPTKSYTGYFSEEFNKLFEDKDKISKEEFIEEFEDCLRMEGIDYDNSGKIKED